MRFKMTNFFFIPSNKIPEKSKPVKHHSINEISGVESKIIFFKTAASHPENNNAQNLRIISFLNNSLKLNPSSTVSKIYQLPQIINNIPAKPILVGISSKNKNPNTSPTMHL